MVVREIAGLGISTAAFIAAATLAPHPLAAVLAPLAAGIASRLAGATAASAVVGAITGYILILALGAPVWVVIEVYIQLSGIVGLAPLIYHPLVSALAYHITGLARERSVIGGSVEEARQPP